MKEKEKIYAGTTNRAKLKAIGEAFEGFEVISVPVPSGVSGQPLSEEETLAGAENRARGLPEGFRIGLEAGITKIKGRSFMINFGVLIDPDGEEYYAGGTYLPLPNEIVTTIYKEGKELKEAMMKYSKGADLSQSGGAVSVFTDGEIKRSDIFVHICKLLYGQYRYYLRRKER